MADEQIGLINLRLVTPDSLEQRHRIKSITVQTDNGEVEILPNHADYLANVEVSILTIRRYNDEIVHYAVGGGAIHFNNKTNTTSLIVNTFIPVEKIDIEKTKKAQEEALQKLKNSTLAHEHKQAELSLKTALVEAFAKNNYQK